MSDPTSLTLAQARQALRGRALSARELAEAHIAAIEAARALNLFIVETPEKALAMAERSVSPCSRMKAATCSREGRPGVSVDVSADGDGGRVRRGRGMAAQIGRDARRCTTDGARGRGGPGGARPPGPSGRQPGSSTVSTTWITPLDW